KSLSPLARVSPNLRALITNTLNDSAIDTWGGRPWFAPARLCHSISILETTPRCAAPTWCGANRRKHAGCGRFHFLTDSRAECSILKPFVPVRNRHRAKHTRALWATAWHDTISPSIQISRSVKFAPRASVAGYARHGHYRIHYSFWL